ncbi:hypothetical protein Tco_0337428 [Tanacetum coccineum]
MAIRQEEDAINPVNNTNPNNMTPESIQAMIDQALLRNSTNGESESTICTRIKNDTKLLSGRVLLWIGSDWFDKNLRSRGTDVPESLIISKKPKPLICTKFVANETKKVDKYISRLPDNIYGNVKSARPKTLDETIELANDLMVRKTRTYAEKAV